jgi:hypothetical protein
MGPNVVRTAKLAGRRARMGLGADDTRGSTVANRRGGQSDVNRRPTKAERKDQARKEREALQRRLSKQRRTRRLGLVLASVGVVAVVVAVALWPGGLPSADDLLGQATQAARAAGCQKVKTVDFYGGIPDPASSEYVDQAHIGGNLKFLTPPPLTSYPSTPPTSGPHNAVPAASGVYDAPPDVYQTIHSLEHAATIIWYRPGTSSEELDRIREYYGQKISREDVGQSKVIVAPYSYPSQGAAGSLPDGDQMVLVAWHRMQVCQRPSLAVAYAFTSRFNNATPGGTYEGVAPEQNNTI